jgi:hypothetical protein
LYIGHYIDVGEDAIIVFRKRTPPKLEAITTWIKNRSHKIH